MYLKWPVLVTPTALERSSPFLLFAYPVRVLYHFFFAIPIVPLQYRCVVVEIAEQHGYAFFFSSLLCAIGVYVQYAIPYNTCMREWKSLSAVAVFLLSVIISSCYMLLLLSFVSLVSFMFLHSKIILSLTKCQFNAKLLP